MCGIAGYIGSREIEQEAVGRCLDLLRSRGPDDEGVQRFDIGPGRRAWFLNRRLRIIDLDPRAGQPLEVDGRHITYNGELYNYLELRDALEAEGVSFRTTSDTEVLDAALARWGLDALDRCEGMWAFALLDTTDGSITLCRDRFGEKPLYLFRDATGLYFASEVKALQALAGRRFEPNIRHLCRYLVNGYKALYKTDDTFHVGVSELAPGTWLRIDASGRESRRAYWTPRVCPNEAMSYEDAVAGVRQRLERTVQLRLRADVPLAFCLSGGVDSNALAAVARHVLGYDVHGFTVVDRDPRYDESALARLSAQALGIRHTEVAVKPDGFLDDLQTLVRYHDAPVATISYFVHWQLMKEVARAGYKVSVSGTGADELLTGYYDHHLFYLYDVRGDSRLFAETRRNWETHLRPHVRNPLLKELDRFVSDPRFRDHIYLDAAVFAGFLHHSWGEEFAEVAYTEAGVLRNRMLNELFHESVPVILHEDDLNAMFHSIENRSPYLDRELFEFCGRIPTRHLIRNGFAKAILRDAVRDLVSPAIVDNRQKVGFNASILSLLDTRSATIRAEVLGDGPIFELVRRDAIAPLLDTPHLTNSQSKFLFNFLNARLFLEETTRPA
jgi:asparagine synthase (glutamine-hydrolysing)